MELHLQRRSGEPLWRQIHRQLQQRILSGHLPPGTRLPPERILAARLAVGRATVVEAYRELAADGLVTARVGSGTRVAVPPAAAGARPAGGRPAGSPAGDGLPGVAGGAAFDWSPLLGSSLWPDEAPLMREVRAVRAAPGRIALGHGELSPALMPAARLGQLLAEAPDSGLSWSYGPAEGYRPLREAVARRLGRPAADEVVVTAGAQHGVSLLGRALAEPGDAVAVETPSYFRSLTLLQGMGLRVLPVPADQEGIRVDILADLVMRHRPRLILVSPNFQNPTGACLSLERRRQLLAVARRLLVPVVDYDVYGELHFGPPLPSLRALDPTGPVVEVSSFSKTVASGLRLGWVAAPGPVAERVAAIKAQTELTSPVVQQWVMARFMERGWLDEHLAGLRQHLRERRDVLAGALAQHLPGATWQPPAGGMHLWLLPPADVPALAWFRAAARTGVAVTPGDLYGAPEGLRLNFAYPPAAELEEGVRRLARALRRVKREAPDPAGSGALV